MTPPRTLEALTAISVQRATPVTPPRDATTGAGATLQRPFFPGGQTMRQQEG